MQNFTPVTAFAYHSEREDDSGALNFHRNQLTSPHGCTLTIQPIGALGSNVFGLQSLLDPMTLIILGVLVLCLVLWGVFAARRRPSLRATVQDGLPLPVPIGGASPVNAMGGDGSVRSMVEPSVNPFAAPMPTAYVPPPPVRPQAATPPVMPVAATAASFDVTTGEMRGPFPLPPADMPLLDSRVVAPTEVVVLWRAVSRDVEEYTVRIDTVSHDQLVFGGLVHNSRTASPNGALERRLFHTMVLPDESMLSIRTRSGTPIKNVRAWLRSLPDAR